MTDQYGPESELAVSAAESASTAVATAGVIIEGLRARGIDAVDLAGLHMDASMVIAQTSISLALLDVASAIREVGVALVNSADGRPEAAVGIVRLARQEPE